MYLKVYLLTVLVIYVNACGPVSRVRDSSGKEDELNVEDQNVESKTDIAGSLKHGYKRVKEMVEQRTSRDVEQDEKQSSNKIFGSKSNEPFTYETIHERVRKHGYPFEEHQVVTPDGYILAIHRIPYGKQLKLRNIKRKPVFLQHGLMSSSDSWLLHRPEFNLPYLLADAGFDVWMGNVRGNKYSKKNQKFNQEQPEFYNFSFDDIAKHDLPSMIDYIIKFTDVPHIKQYTDQDELLNTKFGEKVHAIKREQHLFKEKLNEKFRDNKGKQFFMNPKGKLHYIGHSEGSLLGFVQFGRDKNLASKISFFVALSPISKIGASQSSVSKFLKNNDLSKVFSGPEVFSDPKYLNNFLNKICSSDRNVPEICQDLLSYSKNPKSKDHIQYFLTYFPAGTSSKNLHHYSQLAKSGKFQAYDYGSSEKNQARYKQNVPPEYNLNDVLVPVGLYYGKEDFLVNNKDYEYLKKNLPNVVYEDLIDAFGHFDFVVSKNAKDLVYNKLVKSLLPKNY